MSRVRCSGCGFTGPGHVAFSLSWRIEHEQVHLARFPDLDPGSRENLAAATARAGNQ